MDVALDFVDEHFFSPYVYSDSWQSNNAWRQFLTLNIIVNLGGALLYVITASLSYTFVFDKRLLKHPQSLPVRLVNIECLTEL